jgi:ATP-GRASP peptide maturase of grasp-with-spasm system
MVLIISEDGDQSTNEVIKWLRFYGKKIIRINMEDSVTITHVCFDSIIPEIFFRINEGEVYGANSISSYWFRRGGLKFPIFLVNDLHIKNKLLQIEIITNLQEEITTIKDLFFFILEKKNKIGSYYTANNNKWIHLTIAKDVGLEVPESIICTEKKTLFDFYEKQKKTIIIKPISDGVMFHEKSEIESTSFAIYTNTVSESDISKFPTTFYPTLLQKQIHKKFELRIFYLKKKMFAMAIFSQKDSKTNIDFRRYNKTKANYRVPFKLPKIIKNKLTNFMKLVNLDTGSIDMIYSTDNKYYFLEVNPVGQFGMVSYPCNYNLEKEIAKTLIK